MEFKESKLEWTVVLMAGLLLLGVLSVFRYFGKPSQIETSADISYEMPRPVNSELDSEFSLGDREILRQYINTTKKTGPDNKNHPVAAIPKKKDNKKKDAKKAEAQRHRPLVDIDIIEREEARRRLQEQEEQQQPPGNIAPPEVPLPEVAEKDLEKTPAKSIGEWQTLLMSQPTKKNMDAFISAWRAGDVKAAEFYRVIGEMLKVKNKESQSVALYGLQSVPHVQSFATIAHYYDTLLPENQLVAMQILMAYSHPSRLDILSQALAMNDMVVVRRAAEAVTFGLERAKSGQTFDPRQNRGNTTPVTKDFFERFVPQFTQFLQSSDSTLINLANSFLRTWNS